MCNAEFPDPTELGPFDFAELGIDASATFDERYRAMVSPVFHPAALAHVDRIRAQRGWKPCVVSDEGGDA